MISFWEIGAVSIYKPCGICGDAAMELSSPLYEAWGRTLGRRVPPGAKFLVGGDHRESTPDFLAALVDGLCQAGVDAVHLGQIPTPMIFYAARRVKAAACAVVTAPKNDPARNGLRWMIGDHQPASADVAALEKAVEAERAGQGGAPADPRGRTARARTAPRDLDVSFDYVATLQETFADFMSTQKRVVIDATSCVWTGKARRYLQAIFPQCIFSTVGDAAVGDTAIPPQPTETSETGKATAADDDRVGNERAAALCEAVYCERAQLGLGFDGDSLILVDDEGVALRSEEAAWTLLQCLGGDLRGRRFVYDHKFSQRIPEAVRLLGGEPVVERSNCVAIAERMRETDAMFGADVSGRYYFRVWSDSDDSLYAACRALAHLARSGRTLSSFRRECPPIFATPDLCVPAAPCDEIVSRLRAAWSEFPQQTLDGLRIETPGGWALVQPGEREHSLAFRFEALDWHALDDLVERFCDLMPECGEELWGRYRTAIG
jgi:phosphomannomutase